MTAPKKQRGSRLGETKLFALRMPVALSEAIAEASTVEFMTDAEWARRAIIKELKAQGLL